MCYLSLIKSDWGKAGVQPKGGWRFFGDFLCVQKVTRVRGGEPREPACENAAFAKKLRPARPAIGESALHRPGALARPVRNRRPPPDRAAKNFPRGLYLFTILR